MWWYITGWSGYLEDNLGIEDTSRGQRPVSHTCCSLPHPPVCTCAGRGQCRTQTYHAIWWMYSSFRSLNLGDESLIKSRSCWLSTQQKLLFWPFGVCLDSRHSDSPQDQKKKVYCKKHCQRHNGPEGWVHITRSQFTVHKSWTYYNFRISITH